MNTKLYFKLNELNGDKLFSLALFFMYEAGGDGDCCVVSPNWCKLAEEFEIWLKTRKNTFSKHDYSDKEIPKIVFSNENWESNEEFICFQPTYSKGDERFHYWMLIELVESHD